MIFARFKLGAILIILIFLLSGLNLAQNVSSPKEVLGFEVGADYHLATYTQALEYFRHLEKSSDRIKLFEAGKTSMGLTMVYAVISLPENLQALQKFQDIARQLSLARGLNPKKALELAQTGKAIVYIDGGLHASECAPAQHNIQLAYNLVTASDSKTMRILKDVILVLVYANPDGMNLLAEWYHPNVGTPYEASRMPRLYHIYAGHDNNRDSYIANLIETQHLTRIVNKEWYPVILYNHHQTAPFPARIWTPPNSEPTNPNVHPLIVRWQNMVGSAMGAAFDAEGKEGAISRLIFDSWFPGYVTQVVDSHNIISILTETALYRYATPYFYTIRDFPQQYQDLTMSAFYPNPWKGGWWRLKDAVDYCVTASMAVLDVASKYRQELLYNKFQMGSDVINRFNNEPPYAWIIPEKQMDPGTVSLLLNRMILLGIDVYKCREDFTCDGIQYPTGTHIIPMSQPFALFIKNMFEEQKYPDLRKYPDLWQGVIRPKQFVGAPMEAYDQMGWTLPYQFGAHVVAANSPIDPAMDKVKEVRLQVGQVKGSPGYGYILRHEQNNSFTAMNLILENKGKVLWALEDFRSGGISYPAGTILVPANSIAVNRIRQYADDLDLVFQAISQQPKVKTMNINKVRLGLYKPWTASADEGWTRFILEKYDFPFTNVHDAEIRVGNLNNNYDVLIIPSIRPQSIIEGNSKGTIPPQYVGGITLSGLRNLKKFVNDGGSLVLINSSCALAIESFQVPVKNVLANLSREDFVCNGSIIRMKFDSHHPVAFGMPGEAGVVFNRSFAFEILPTFKQEEEAKSIAKYPKENPLMSGYIHGDRYLRQKSSIVEVKYGNGKIILLGFPVQFRAQPHGTFKLLFNAILYGGNS